MTQHTPEGLPPLPDFKALASKAATASAIIGGLPERTGYNGSILQIDDEAERISKDLDEVATALRSINLEAGVLPEPCDFEPKTAPEAFLQQKMRARAALQASRQAALVAVDERETIIRAAVAAMPHTNPGVADDLIEGHTMHTEAEDIIAIWRAALAAQLPAEPAMVPLDDQQILAGLNKTTLSALDGAESWWGGVRFAEQHHGINGLTVGDGRGG